MGGATLKILLGTAALAALGTVVLLFTSRQPSPPPAEEILRSQLALTDNRLHRLGQTNLFSGVVVELYGTNSLKSRSMVSAGLLHGLSEGWHTNGQLAVREYFTNGVSHGMRVKWHPNGRKLSEANIVQGQIEGLFRRWHEDGSLSEEVPMKAGQPDGLARSYFASGYLKAEASLRQGQVLTQRFWKDGEQAASALAGHSPPARKDL
ncbi:MAG: toxin-antitoxin system YwqK family antitoxin [Verrucomicrobia bacterium]|nr:toxin-antitoxin system YwqK family antitoxin [Verrucomicrobiota bacterium]